MAKILIADDSPTIHKVVQLTLSSSGHNLDIAANPDELFSKSADTEYDLVLLDFTLSDKEDGYELARKLNEKRKTKILAMLGTFDSIEDNKMVETGILDKIQKPFESQKFINLCNRLIETDLESFFATESSEEISDDNQIEDEWVVNGQPSMEGNNEDFNLSSDSEDLNETSEFSSEELHNELNSWGVRVPEVIGKAANAGPVFPPVISETEEKSQDLASLVDDELSDEGNTFDLSHEQSQKEKDLSFISVAELAPEEEEDEWHTDTDTNHSKVPSNQLLEKELEGVTSDDFWAIDEHSDESDMNFSTEDNEQVEEIREDLAPVTEEDQEENSFTLNFEEAQMKEEDFEFPEVKKQPAEIPQYAEVNIDEIVEKVTAKIADQLEEIVKRAIESKVEEISWEVIPDLAENLIKKEIRRISDSVIDSH